MPLVLRKTGAVFLHPMKCGGTWVRDALTEAGIEWDDAGNQHADYSYIPEHYTAPVFTVIRHPFAWYKSFWSYRMARGWGGNLPLGHGRCRRTDLNQFVLCCIRDHPGFLSAYYDSFTVDTVMVMRNERLADDLCDVLGVIGESFDAEKLRGTPPSNVYGSGINYPQSLTQTVKTLIVQSECEAFLKWGFSVE